MEHDEVARLRLMLEGIEEGVSLLDADMVVVEQNRAAHDLMRMHVTEEPGRRLFSHPDDLGWIRLDGTPFPPEEQPTPMALRTGRPQTDVIVGRPKPDGSVRWIRISSYPIAEAGRAPHAVVAVVRDVTGVVHAERELRRLATHDGLTGLANRAMLHERLEEALGRGHVDGAALLYCDLDRFKVVNDSMGHNAGDRLLAVVAGRIQDVLRPGDLAARLGGDELVVLTTGHRTADEVDAVAAELLSVVGRPIELGGLTIEIGVSIGVVDLRAGSTPEELLRDADTAMYVAKQSGRGRSVRFTDDLRAAAVRRLELEAELRRGVRGGELRLHYQPVFELGSGELRSLEALVRWQHPHRGLLGPAEFVGVAEESGLIIEVGEWVLATACADLAASGLADRVRVAVNLSAHQLVGAGVTAAIADATAAAGIAPSRLAVELTESALFEAGPSVVAELRALADLGVEVALDDFGTGWSSLTYLRRFPIHVIKVDRSFVAGLADASAAGRDDRVIVQAVVDLAAGLGRSVVAEGIETPEQRHALVAMGCPFGQGFLLGRPAPIGEVLAALGEPPPGLRTGPLRATW